MVHPSEALVGTQLTHRYTAFKDHVTLRDYEINDGMVSAQSSRRHVSLTCRVWRCTRRDNVAYVHDSITIATS